MELDNFKMERVCFNKDEEILEKLKEYGVLTKTKKIEHLKELRYKTIKDNKELVLECEILAFNWKRTKLNCINPTYENLTIKIEDREFEINIEFFKQMQKKDFFSIAKGEENISDNIEEENLDNEEIQLSLFQIFKDFYINEGSSFEMKIRDFKKGDVILFCNEEFEVIENYGTTGKVKQGNEVISNEKQKHPKCIKIEKTKMVTM